MRSWRSARAIRALRSCRSTWKALSGEVYCPSMAARPAVILSPHLDDAVLSCWHLLSGPGDVSVINVFAGSPPPGSGASWWDRLSGATDSAARMAERLAEDREAFAIAGRTATISTSSTSSTSQPTSRWGDRLEASRADRPERGRLRPGRARRPRRPRTGPERGSRAGRLRATGAPLRGPSSCRAAWLAGLGQRDRAPRPRSTSLRTGTNDSQAWPRPAPDRPSTTWAPTNANESCAPSRPTAPRSAPWQSTFGEMDGFPAFPYEIRLGPVGESAG